MFSNKAIYVIVTREFKRFFRQKGRLVVTIARPLLWLFILGSGFSRIIVSDSAVNYIQFILPGIVGMTILFSSIFSTMSVVWDREFGFLREMLVAPVPRVAIVAGKLLSGTLLSVVQGAALLIVAPFLNLHVGAADFAAMVALMFIVALAITAFGLFIASFLTNLEGFNVIMNFIVLPMFFLSGALYPVSELPAWLMPVTYLNPLCFGVDSFKHVLLKAGGRLGAEYPMYFDVAYLCVYAAIFVMLAAFVFERKK